MEIQGAWILVFVLIVLFGGLSLFWMALSPILRKRRLKTLPEKLEAENWQVRWEALQKFNSVLTPFKDEQIFHLLLKALEDDHENVRQEAVIGLRKMFDDRIIEPLCTALNDKSGKVRLEAVSALGNLRDIRVFPPLLKVLGDEEESVRTCAEAELREVCPLVEAILFGHEISSELTQRGTVHNPDVSHLTIRMSGLKYLVIETTTADLPLIEKFIAYGANTLGQKALKRQVDVHVYGDPEILHSDLRNILADLFRSVTMHDEE